MGKISSNNSSGSSSHSRLLKSELIKDAQRDRINRARKAINEHAQRALYAAEAEYAEQRNQEELFEKSPDVGVEEEKK